MTRFSESFSPRSGRDNSLNLVTLYLVSEGDGGEEVGAEVDDQYSENAQGQRDLADEEEHEGGDLADVRGHRVEEDLFLHGDHYYMDGTQHLFIVSHPGTKVVHRDH